MKWNDEGFLAPHLRDAAATVPAVAIRVCPFNPHPEPAVEDEDALARHFIREAPHWDEKSGHYSNSYIGYSTEFRTTSSSGGIATYVFRALLVERHVDHLFIVLSDGAGGYRYALHSDAGQIQTTSKTRYFPVTLDELFSIIDSTPGTIAVSGVACFNKAIRLKQFYHPELRAKIPFLIGIICGGLKSRFFTEFLAQSSGITGAYSNPEYRIKDAHSLSSDYSFGALDAERKQHAVKMRTVGDMWGTGFFKAKACDFCTDVLSELADISLGDAWLPEYRKDGLGNSVIVTRSAMAEQIIQAGIERGELIASQAPIEQIIESQRASFAHRHDALKFRAWMAQSTDRISLPFVRQRMLRSISAPYAVVQVCRERTRRKTLEYWKGNPEVKDFNARMRPHLFLLKFVTRVYHRLRRK